MYARPAKRPKSSPESDFGRLVILANKEGCETDHERALWLIDNTEYWRAKGYTNIIERLKDHANNQNMQGLPKHVHGL